jgi:hypothetical protein
MVESEVVGFVGEPEAQSRSWSGEGIECAWHESGLQITFDAAGQAAEIMVCRPITATLNGIDLLETPADTVVEALSDIGQGGYEEDGYSYVFRDVHLALWRQCRPSEEPDDDEQTRGGRFWDTATTWR